MGQISVKVVKEAIWKSLSTIINKAGALIFVILLARFLKPEGFGIYNLALSVVLMFALFAEIGINKTLLRYVSHALKNNNKKQATAYVNYLFKIKIILTALFSILLLIIAYPLSHHIFKKPELFWPLIICALYLITLSFEKFYEYFFYIIKKVRFITIKETLFQIIKVGLALLVFITISGYNRILGVLLSITVASFMALVFSILILKRKADFVFKTSDSKINKKKVLSFLKYLTIGGLSIAIYGYIDMVMLGVFLPSNYAGYYSAAVTLVWSLIAIVSIPNVLTPMFTQLKNLQLNDSFNRVYKYICILTIPMVFGSMALGKYFIKALYGQEYLPAVIPFYIFSITIFGGVLIDSSISLFSAREQPKYFVKMLVVTAVMNIILNYILIKSLMPISYEWAIAGAAIATVISRYFYCFSLIAIAKEKLKITFNIKYFIKPLISSLIMFIVLFTINKSLVYDMTLIIGAAEIILGITIYLTLMFIMKGLDKEDCTLIKELISNRRTLKNDK
jgi:stage V sporulation protein B